MEKFVDSQVAPPKIQRPPATYAPNTFAKLSDTERGISTSPITVSAQQVHYEILPASLRLQSKRSSINISSQASDEADLPGIYSLLSDAERACQLLEKEQHGSEESRRRCALRQSSSMLRVSKYTADGWEVWVDQEEKYPFYCVFLSWTRGGKSFACPVAVLDPNNEVEVFTLLRSRWKTIQGWRKWLACLLNDVEIEEVKFRAQFRAENNVHVVCLDDRDLKKDLIEASQRSAQFRRMIHCVNCYCDEIDSFGRMKCLFCTSGRDESLLQGYDLQKAGLLTECFKNPEVARGNQPLGGLLYGESPLQEISQMKQKNYAFYEDEWIIALYVRETSAANFKVILVILVCATFLLTTAVIWFVSTYLSDHLISAGALAVAALTLIVSVIGLKHYQNQRRKAKQE